MTIAPAKNCSSGMERLKGGGEGLGDGFKKKKETPLRRGVAMEKGEELLPQRT